MESRQKVKVFTYRFYVLENNEPKCIHKSDTDELPKDLESSKVDIYVLKWNSNAGLYETYRVIDACFIP